LFKRVRFDDLFGELCTQLKEYVAFAGVPEGLIGLCVGDGRVGRWVTEQDIDAMVFIGSYPVGVQIAAALGPRLIPCITEIGGKDAYFIAADVDIPKALALLVPGKFDNTGQSCNAVDRLFIDDAIYDTFVEQYAAAASALPQGDPFDVNTVLGPITRSQNFSILDGQVADAISKGGRIVCGGSRLSRPGYWFPATAIADCTPDMLCMTQETFGPIVSLARVPHGTSDAQIVDMLNDSEFGLTGGVFCSDRARAASIMAELNVGTAYWNCCGMVEPSTPWSGRKHSGIGMIMGPAGIRHCFLAPKSSYFMHAQ
jgi:acyl-CoA reductase-like NAD-dependent aldehyde dehydrogenase